MGIVLRASDPDFGRTLAVKVLLDHRSDDEAACRRFLDEARLCGQLQHPGIPPVHEMGTVPDGRPFFAMKLVKGDTLAALLDRRANPAEDLPRWLAVFEQVCQTVAYAHSRGVLHRDLKPLNVMVGAFGEVQVMDWGLAKILSAPADAAVTAAAESSTLDTGGGPGPPEETAPGSILGTPAFMPPEQARGQIDDLDERADVFALGAILCVILTGQAPYGSARPALQQAKEGGLAEARARLEGCGADGGLVRLTLGCLAFRPADRPRDAAAVAGAVAAYRAGVEEQLRQAEVARAAAQARADAEGRERQAAQAKAAAERRARRLTAGLAAAVLLLVVAAGGGAWLWQQQRQAEWARRKGAIDQAEPALERARALLDDGWLANDPERLKEARAEAVRAAEIAHGGGVVEVQQQAEALRQEIEGRLARAEKNRALLLALLDIAAPHETRAYRGDGGGAVTALAELSVEEQYAAAFRRWGLDVDHTDEAEAVARLRDEPEALRQGAAAGLDAWMLHRRGGKLPEAEWRRLYWLAERVDGDEGRRQLRTFLVSEVPPRPEGVAGLVAAWPPWPALWELARGEKWRRLLALQEQIDPAAAPVQTVVLLAQASAEVGDAAGAERLLRRAAAARPDEVVLLDTLGKVLERRGRSQLAEAIGCYRAARAVRPRLGVALARALRQAGRASEGEAVLRDLLRQQPNNPELHFYLGLALYDQRKLDEAVAAFRGAIALKPDYAAAYNNLGAALREQKKLREAVAAYHKAIDLKGDFAAAYSNLGTALAAQGKLAEAVAAFRRAIELKGGFAPAYCNLGAALREQGKPDEAVAACRKAIDLKGGFAAAYSNLGAALRDQGKPGEAIDACRKAIDLQPDFALAYTNLGNALADQRRLGEAVVAFRKAIDLKKDYALAYTNLGNALADQGKLEEAVAAYRRAIALKPEDAAAHNNLGNALRDQRELGEAVAAYRKAIDLKKDYALAYYNLGNALADQGKLEEAVAAFQKAVALKPDLAEASYNLGNALRAQGKPGEAVAAYREAIRLRPTYPEAHCNLGTALAAQGKLAEAVAAFRKAIALKPDLAAAHASLGAALREQGKPGEAVAACRKAIALQPDYALAHTNLGAALADQGKLDESIAAFQKAIELQPDEALTYSNLGNALRKQKKLGEAVAACRKAIALKPDYATAYNNLGNALYDQRELGEAVAAYCRAIELQPDDAKAYYNLGNALRDQGKLAEAVAAYRKADQLLPNHPLICNNLRYAKGLLQLDRKLTACLAGKDRPDSPRQAAELAAFCGRYRERYHAAVRLYTDAFRNDPALADHPQIRHRYHAACCAAFAAAGQGQDAAALAEGERTDLRRQALTWLRADLDSWRRRDLDGNPRDRADVAAVMRGLQSDARLIAVRHPWSLLRLPTDERRRWQKLWADVDELLKKASKTGT
jgi:tetratricopeptide (TPR) repeat protein